MNRIHLLVPVLFIALGANAQSLLQTLQPSPTVQASNDDACENFSGNWKGSCTSAAGEKIDEAFTVTQSGCDAIVLKGADHQVYIPVGGQASGDIAVSNCAECGNKPGVLHATMEAHWDSYKKVVTMHSGVIAKVLTGDSAPKAYFVKSVAQIKDYKLVVDVFEMASDKKVKFCELAKVR